MGDTVAAALERSMAVIAGHRLCFFTMLVYLERVEVSELLSFLVDWELPMGV